MEKIRRIIKITAAEIPLMLLCLPKNKIGAVAVILLFFAAGVLIGLYGKSSPERSSVEESVIALFISICCGVLFYTQWQNTARAANFAVIFSIPTKQCCAILTAILCLTACFGLMYLFRFFPVRKYIQTRQKTVEILFLLMLAAGTITFASKCSPFYPFNDWVDPQTMFTLGKGMLRGRVPYRDLYEQKGPLLLALHALAALISFDSLLGVWLVEIAACFGVFWFLYKILKERFGRRALCMLPFLAVVIYLPRAFVAGDTAEEMSLPFITYALYVGVMSILKKRLPKRKEAFLIGITSGCVLWIKFSHLGFYAGWFLYFLICAVKWKKTQELLFDVRNIMCGVALTFLPVFLYFAINHATGIFLECYFLNNIRYYPAFGSAQGPFRYLINLWRGLIRFKESNVYVLILFFIGLLWCYMRKAKNLGFFMLLTFLTGYLVIFFSGTSFPYYVMIFGSFSVSGIMWLMEIPALKERNLPNTIPIFFILCIEAILFLSPNLYVVRYNLEDFPQYKAKLLIEESEIENPSLLHYGLLDAGYNLMTGIVPQQRFFSFFNLKLPGMAEEQDRYIKEGTVDFVVTCHVPLYETDNYELIDTSPGDFTKDGSASLFFLYKRTNTVTSR